MKQFNKLIFTFYFVIAAGVSVVAQNRFFKDANVSELSQVKEKRMITPDHFRALTVNSDQLKSFLWSLPSEINNFNRSQAPIMELPMPDGSSARFRVWESSIQEPGLEAKFPGIKTFLGQGIDDPYAVMRFDFTDFGFHAAILSVNGNIYIDPYARGNVNNYISYYIKDNHRANGFICEVQENLGARAANIAVTGPCRGTQLYTYRLAVACTGEYAVAVGGTTAALLHSAIVTTVNRVVGVYENELSVRMVLVANNNLIEFLNAATDPFNGNNNAGTLITESQTVITNAIGSANFDIGHTFSTGGGGLAGLGVVCVNSQKARGITGSPSPVGDNYDIDYVAHEIGHQFGGNHTFNSTTSNCGGGNRNASTAYETGSGTTIMAYAGICTTDDIQAHSDPFFHAVSFDEISNYIEAGGANCRVVTATGNNLPVITSMSNNNINIPLSTPFTLTGAATDADGDAITYCWEEWDLGTGGAWNNGAASTTAPLFKSRIPKTSGSRTFPDIARIIANYLPATPTATMGGLKGETLPTVARAIKFRLTVRDNRAGGGSVVSGGNGCQAGLTTVFQVNTITATGPFIVTVPNGGESYAGGSTQTITWNVAGTDLAPISAANVKISLSTDGGLTYPTVMISSTPNDGTEALAIPSIATTTARIKVEAVGNVFFDISNANFTITAAANGFTFNNVAPTTVSCGGPTSASTTLATASQGGFTTPISLSATGNPAGTAVTFSVNPLVPGNSSLVTLTNTNTLAAGTYNITVTGVAGTITQSSILAFTVAPGTPPSITTQPAAIQVCAGSNALFNVVAPGSGLSYQWQVSSGAGPFSNIPGANAASYTVSGTTASQNNNQYQVIVSTLCGTTNSSAAILTVNSSPAIMAQPVNAVICAGNNNTFSVTATGAGLTYQWQESITGCGGVFVNIPGAIASSYTLSNINIGQNGYAYQCVITGSCAPTTVTSNCVTLSVSSSVGIVSQPASASVCSGSMATFDVTASGTGINYQWQVSTGGPFTNIVGANSPTLTLLAVTAAQNGNQYQAVLTNTTCTVPSITSAATLTVNDLPAITSQPVSVTVCAAGNTTFVSSGTGTNATYQWQVSINGGTSFSDIAGATNASYTLNAVTASMNNNQYHLVVNGTCTPSAISNAAILTVISPSTITTQPLAITACQGTNATFTVAGNSGGAPAIIYQWQVSTGGPFSNIAGANAASFTATAVTPAMNGNQYQVLLSNATCPATLISNAVALTVNNLPVITAAADATSVCTGTAVSLTATGAGSGTYTWAPGSGLTGATVMVNPSVNPSTPGVANPILYTVTGTDGNGCVSTASVSVTANPLPVVTLSANPAYTTILPGQTILLTASVTPTGNFIYSWTQNGVSIPNTSDSLRVGISSLGNYEVTVADPSGTCANTSNIINVVDSVTNKFYIYPNPNDGRFNIVYKNPNTIGNVSVFDSRGSRIYNAINKTQRLPYQLISVDLRPVASGVYIIALYDKSGVRLASEKVVVR